MVEKSPPAVHEYIVPLGVSAAVPSGDRHFASVAFVAERFVVLFDCGEGTQFRLLDAGIKTSRIAAIAISHAHGDHYLGLPGLLSTMTMQHRTEPLTLICPTSIAVLLEAMPGIGGDYRPFELDVRAIEADFTAGELFTTGAGDPDTGCTIAAEALDHTIETYGYRLTRPDRPGNLDVERARALGVTDYEDYRRLKEGKAVRSITGDAIRPDAVVSDPVPGRVFAYVSDSRPCDAAVRLGRNADLLYHEATFGAERTDRANETGHSTAAQAAGVARRADVARLLLGHFSARYDDASVLETEARSVFANTAAARELERYYLDA